MTLNIARKLILRAIRFATQVAAPETRVSPSNGNRFAGHQSRKASPKDLNEKFAAQVSYRCVEALSSAYWQMPVVQQEARAVSASVRRRTASVLSR